MDLTTILIGIGAVALMVAPIFLIQISNKRKESQKLKGLRDHSLSLGININQYKCWDEHFIGLDSNNKKLIFINSIEDKSSFKIFDLKEYKSCELKVDRRGGDSKNAHSSIIERINLILKPVKDSSIESKICFYNSAVNMSLSDELEISQNWEKIVKEAIG